MIHKLSFTKIVLLALLSVALGFGCATTEPPKSFQEQAAYVEAGAQSAIKTIDQNTCYKYQQNGKCVDPVRTLHPAQAKSYLDQIAQARLALKTASSMPASGGSCLGTASTPEACLALASTMLGVVQKILLTTAQKGG
jgi:hypothetical protein